MAGSLIKVDEFTISSAVASVILGGGSSGSSGLNASIDSTYDVYMVAFNNVLPDTDARYLWVRYTVSGTPDTTANYDWAMKDLRADTTFGNNSFPNATMIQLQPLGTAGNEQSNGIFYLYNFNNSSEYSFMTIETSAFIFTGVHRGFSGGAVNTVAQACDGIEFSIQLSNIASGTFTLYGLKK